MNYSTPIITSNSSKNEIMYVNLHPLAYQILLLNPQYIYWETTVS